MPHSDSISEHGYRIEVRRRGHKLEQITMPHSDSISEHGYRIEGEGVIS